MKPCIVLLALLQPAAALVPVLGLPWVEADAPPLRRDINELVRGGGPQLNLFILALENLQARNEDDENSYFQIAGIHGLPAMPYNNVPLPVAEEPGYCTHYSTAFPPWHRTYLLLFESKLVQAAREIAKKYPMHIRDEYVREAAALRLPYWDWLQDAQLPEVVTKETISVFRPEGLKESTNPLFTYRFQARSSIINNLTSDIVDSRLWQTVRHPSLDGRSNHTAANIALRSRESLLLSVAHSCLKYTSIYNDFARMPHPVDPFDSNIEVLHNAVHNAAGGKRSHLSTTEFAAFDPVFWLHHANLDRVFAFWQTSNPQFTMFSEGNSFNGDEITKGFSVNWDIGLAPFLRENGDLWTPRQVWEWETLGYTYPELAGGELGDEPKENGSRERRLQKLLNRTYWYKFQDEL